MNLSLRFFFFFQVQAALEIRSYLHDRSLLQYGDKLESSGKSLPELLNLSAGDLSSQFGMKRGHIARFMDRTSACAEPLLKSCTSTTRTTSAPTRNSSIYKILESFSSKKMQNSTRSMSRTSTKNDKSLERSLADFKIRDGYSFKGIVAAEAAGSRASGFVNPPPVVDKVAPYSALENISVEKLTPEYKIGMQSLLKARAPPMKASELWRDRPAVLLCIRRPG